MASKFYGAKDSKESAQAMSEIQSAAPITHVVVDPRQTYLLDPLRHEKVFSDDKAIIAELRHQ
jgi:hypothetical protein